METLEVTTNKQKSESEENLAIHCVAPSAEYELVPVLDLKATMGAKKDSIEISSFILINSSHGIKPSMRYRIVSSSSPRDNLVLDAIFEKGSDILTNSFNYFNFNLSITKEQLEERNLNITDIQKITLHLKSDNPRTSRGTVTTVKPTNT